MALRGPKILTLFSGLKATELSDFNAFFFLFSVLCFPVLAMPAKAAAPAPVLRAKGLSLRDIATALNQAALQRGMAVLQASVSSDAVRSRTADSYAARALKVVLLIGAQGCGATAARLLQELTEELGVANGSVDAAIAANVAATVLVMKADNSANGHTAMRVVAAAACPPEAAGRGNHGVSLLAIGKRIGLAVESTSKAQLRRMEWTEDLQAGETPDWLKSTDVPAPPRNQRALSDAALPRCCPLFSSFF